MITIDDAKSPFTYNVLHDLETDFTPERRQAGSPNSIFVFYRMFLGKKEYFLGSLAQ